MHLTVETASDYAGAKTLLKKLPKWNNRLTTDEHNTEFYKERNKIERAFGIKDWRRVATCYDYYPEIFLSACTLAAIVKFGDFYESS